MSAGFLDARAAAAFALRRRAQRRAVRATATEQALAAINTDGRRYDIYTAEPDGTLRPLRLVERRIFFFVPDAGELAAQYPEAGQRLGVGAAARPGGALVVDGGERLIGCAIDQEGERDAEGEHDGFKRMDAGGKAGDACVSGHVGFLSVGAAKSHSIARKAARRAAAKTR